MKLAKIVSHVLGFLLVFAMSISAADIDENTMAIWLFNESKGNEIADASGRGHNLEIQGSSKWVAGKFGNALYFEEDAFIEYEAHPDLSFEDGMTIELWLNLEDITPQEVVGIPRKENEYVLAVYEQGDGLYVGTCIMARG